MTTAKKKSTSHVSLASLPVWVMKRGLWTLDVVRAVIRASDELRALGEKFGPVRLYTLDEWSVIEKALTERDARTKGK